MQYPCKCTHNHDKIDAFKALPKQDFEVIVPQECWFVQFMGLPRNSQQIIAKLKEISLPMRSHNRYGLFIGSFGLFV